MCGYFFVVFGGYHRSKSKKPALVCRLTFREAYHCAGVNIRFFSQLDNKTCVVFPHTNTHTHENNPPTHIHFQKATTNKNKRKFYTNSLKSYEISLCNCHQRKKKTKKIVIIIKRRCLPTTTTAAIRIILYVRSFLF